MIGVSLGIVAVAAWLGLHATLLSLALFVVSIGFVTHAPCIKPSGEHGETCATSAGESRSQPAPERPVIVQIATMLIWAAVVLAAQRAWDLIKYSMPSVAEIVTSHWLEQTVIWAAVAAMGLLWVRRVVTSARLLRARASSQQA